MDASTLRQAQGSGRSIAAIRKAMPAIGAVLTEARNARRFHDEALNAATTDDQLTATGKKQIKIGALLASITRVPPDCDALVPLGLEAIELLREVYGFYQDGIAIHGVTIIEPEEHKWLAKARALLAKVPQ